MEETSEGQAHPSGCGRRPKVEIGWILEGDLPEAERSAAKDAAAAMKTSLARVMPVFDWIIETLDRPSGAERERVEPVRLLDAAEGDRDRRDWDFALVVTAQELRGREKSCVLGVTASVFATAIASTAFLADRSSPDASVSCRLHALTMHLFGRLNGLAPDRSGTWTHGPEGPSDLDRMDGFEAEAAMALSTRMEEVADLRVEEMSAEAPGKLSFYARSIWQNRGVLPRVFLRMRPWSFPLKLRRLTTAAGSALAVLVMTAESWEVAANLSVAVILVLSLAAIALTSVYLIRVQHLIASRREPLREQRAVSNVGTVVAVCAGMVVTYAAVFVVAWLLAMSLFGDPLLAVWTGATGPETTTLRLQLAGLTAALSVVIGALGASFEPYGYFRHVTQIDDEI